MFPDCKEIQEDYPLQSKVFGHRLKQSQSLYEYILEFLIVAFSKKTIGGKKYGEDDLFPINIDRDKQIEFSPNNNVGLKRFIFFDKSKQEGRYEYDAFAYKQHLKYIEDIIEIESNSEFINSKYVIELIQNLLYEFGAVIENRSWFAQSLLPICQQTLTAEIMGVKSKRNKIVYEEYLAKVDYEFETNRYNFMCRGGELYYLHVLKAVNNYPEYKEQLEDGFKKLINQFEEFSELCELIQESWKDGSNAKPKEINKKLGTIPDGFSSREEYTLIELCNILNSDMHPFEKIEVMSYGIIFQIIIMSYNQARYSSGKEQGYLIFDINCYKGKSDEEIKKLAAINYSVFEQDFLDALYNNLEGNIKEGKDVKQTIDSAIEDSLKVYKKIGKKIGIIRPVNEKSTRFTINEKTLKFLVASVVRPNTKMTLERFLERLYKHFNMVISKEQYYSLTADISKVDVSFLDKNKNDIQLMLKESGFLRELSDSTSIVENPYGNGEE